LVSSEQYYILLKCPWLCYRRTSQTTNIHIAERVKQVITQRYLGRKTLDICPMWLVTIDATVTIDSILKKNYSLACTSHNGLAAVQGIRITNIIFIGETDPNYKIYNIPRQRTQLFCLEYFWIIYHITYLHHALSNLY
jgi:hypothetical protein